MARMTIGRASSCCFRAATVSSLIPISRDLPCSRSVISPASSTGMPTSSTTSLTASPSKAAWSCLMAWSCHSCSPMTASTRPTARPAWDFRATGSTAARSLLRPSAGLLGNAQSTYPAVVGSMQFEGRAFIVSGPAPSLVSDGNGDGKVTAVDAKLAGYTVISNEVVFNLRMYHGDPCGVGISKRGARRSRRQRTRDQRLRLPDRSRTGQETAKLNAVELVRGRPAAVSPPDVTVRGRSSG